MSNVEVFTNDIKECFTILQQQQVIIKQIKALINYNETDLVNTIENINNNINTSINEVDNNITILEEKINNILNQLTTSALNLSENGTNYSIHATESDGFYIYKGSTPILHILNNQVKFLNGNAITIPNATTYFENVNLNGGARVHSAMPYLVTMMYSDPSIMPGLLDEMYDIDLCNPFDITSIITDPVTSSLTTLDTYTYSFNNSEELNTAIKALLSASIALNMKPGNYSNVKMACKKLGGEYVDQMSNGGYLLRGLYMIPLADYPGPAYSESMTGFKIVMIALDYTGHSGGGYMLSDLKLVLKTLAIIPTGFIGTTS